MRVAIVSKTFVFDAAQRLLECLAQQPDIELTLITPEMWRSDDGRALPFVPRYAEGYAIRPLPVRFNGRYHAYTYRGLTRTLGDLRPDLVHIDEEPFNPAGMQAQLLADRLGARTIFTVLQNLLRRYPPPFSLMEQYNYRRTAHIIACNAAAGEVVRAKGYRGALSQFSVYGVDPDLYLPAERSAPRDGVVIGYIGRLVLYKGLGLLIEALRELPEHCRLRLLGAGPDEDTLRQLAIEQGVASRVTFAPPVPASKVAAELRQMDVLALPSLTRPNWAEQFGRVLIEAMACAVPVVGSSSGEIPNVIGDAGLVVPEGDVEALRAALARLAADPALREHYARAGRQRVLDHFTQEHAARRIAGVYQQAWA